VVTFHGSTCQIALRMVEAPRSLGWATADLIHLDAMAPGLIGRVLTTSPRRRQAIFTVIASRVSGEGGRADLPDDQVLAGVLRHERAREILAYVFGDVPSGWLGALERVDAAPMPTAGGYTKLHAIFTDPRRRSDAALLTRTGTVSETTLAVLDTLDPRWRLPGVLGRLGSRFAASEFNAAIAVVQSACSTATDEVVAQAIARLPPGKSLADLVTRFTARADRFPPHPIQGDAEVRPIMTADHFVRVGLSFRNCLKDRIEDALVGLAAYAEYRDMILEFRPLANGFGWILEDVHIAGNALVPTDVRAVAEAKCRELGIPYIDRDRRPSISRMCRLLRSPAVAQRV
jgi:hypothetical protein